MEYTTRLVTTEDYDAILALWNGSGQSRRALNPVDDSREGIGRYLKRNPSTCFVAERDGRGDRRRSGGARRPPRDHPPPVCASRGTPHGNRQPARIPGRGGAAKGRHPEGVRTGFQRQRCRQHVLGNTRLHGADQSELPQQKHEPSHSCRKITDGYLLSTQCAWAWVISLSASRSDIPGKSR